MSGPVLAKPYTDLCRARGCGGGLRGVEREIADGSIAYCGSCGRAHTFAVYEDGGAVYVQIERKPRGKKR